MPRILLVEDEPAIADVVEYLLVEHGFQVDRAPDGLQGERMFAAACPDLVLLDLNLPGLQGLELFKIMRQMHPAVPVIMMTARSEDHDRILGLELGADDYVTKPFVPRELAARVKAVLRRCADPGPRQQRVINEGPVALDLEARRFTFYGQPVDVTRSEFELLKALASHPAKIYARDELLSRLHDDTYAPTDRTIDACVKRIRKKTAEVRPDADPIQTSYGQGYKLNQGLPEP